MRHIANFPADEVSSRSKSDNTPGAGISNVTQQVVYLAQAEQGNLLPMRQLRLEQALTTLPAASSPDLPPPRARMSSLGRLTQLSMAVGQLMEALRHAQEGFELATQFDDLRERATFKLDEANVLLKLGRHDDALTVGKTCLDLARQAYDEHQEAVAFGVVAQALPGKDSLRDAAEYAQERLEQAQALGMGRAVRAFSKDLEDIRVRLGQRR